MAQRPVLLGLAFAAKKCIAGAMLWRYTGASGFTLRVVGAITQRLDQLRLALSFEVAEPYLWHGTEVSAF
jgi:hypothetical protein